jgi:hypothetical protein
MHLILISFKICHNDKNDELNENKQLTGTGHIQ